MNNQKTLSLQTLFLLALSMFMGFTLHVWVVRSELQKALRVLAYEGYTDNAIDVYEMTLERIIAGHEIDHANNQ